MRKTVALKTEIDDDWQVLEPVDYSWDKVAGDPFARLTVSFDDVLSKILQPR